MLLLIPVLLPVISGSIILIKTWKKKPWRRPRFILISAIINSAVVLGFLIAQYSEALQVTIAGSVTFRLATDGLGTVLAGCMAVLVPLVLCYSLDFGEDRRKAEKTVQKNTLSPSDERKKRTHSGKVKADPGEEKADIRKTEGKRDVFSARMNYLFAAVTGIAFSKNAATMSFFLIILLLVDAWIVLGNGKPEKRYWIFHAGGAVAVILVLMTAVFCGRGASFYFDGYLSGNISNQVLLILYILGFCGCTVRKLASPFFAEEEKPENLFLDIIYAFLLIRLTFSVFGISLLRGTWAQVVVMLLSVAGIMVHSVLAFREKRFRKKMAHLSAASFALILTGIAVMTSHGYTAAVWMTVAFAFTQLLLIFFPGAVKKKENSEGEMSAGLGRRMPVTFGCYVAACLSVCAVPPFAGFLSVWKLAKAFTRQGGLNYLSMAAVFAFLFLAALSLYPSVAGAFFPKSDYAEKEKAEEAGPQMLVPMVVLAAAILATGLFSGVLGDYIYQIGLGLM
ncbi:MAG: hypothetical protein LUE29_00150 [Lachnospiraceae bacterium]|nr:hypothetical protein [Lachnospiraceae bacterium]